MLDCEPLVQDRGLRGAGSRRAGERGLQRGRGGLDRLCRDGGLRRSRSPQLGTLSGSSSRCSPVTKQAWQIGQGVRLTVKYDGLAAETGGVTCF